MPVFSCGGMRYQFKWQDVAPEEVPADCQANLEATIHRALELGINHIETARGYGSSEMQLGWLIPRLPRERIILQTKISPFPTQEEFIERFETSMKYLSAGYLDLLSFHGINDEERLDMVLRKGGCLEVARRLQREGRVRFVGFSTHAACRVIVKTIESGEFDYVNLHWYFVNPLNWPAVEAAARQDMGVFIISPNDKGGKLYSPPPKMVDLCSPITPMQFNDLYCLSRPEVHTLSLGAAQPSDFDEHVAGLDFYDLAADTVQPIETRLTDEMNRILGSEWMEGWWKGIPEWHEIPAEINVLETLRLWMYAKSLDLVEWGQMRYNLLGQANHWFPGNNAGEFDDPSIAQAVNKNPFATSIPGILREAHEMLYTEPQKRLSES